jgi:cystathionine beta-lyase/cystathionine gamma-synthase
MRTHTELIHRGERPPQSGSQPLTTPIYETSTFVFESARDVEKYQQDALHAYLYSRYENPTVVAAEEKIAVVDGAEASLLFSSGMAATSTALLSLLNAGDESCARRPSTEARFTSSSTCCRDSG